ncbi:MAG: hypothetical protein JRF38_10500, partial [Deltaproteobacteria bacterium]|nr:hypothetical protein [Deltaproteobacteria bacterium]
LTPVYHRNGVAYVMVRKLVADHQAIKGARTSAVIIEDLLVNIDTELDFKLAEFMLAQGLTEN